MDEYRTSGKLAVEDREHDLTPPVVDEAEAVFTADSYRFMRMLAMGRTLTTTLSSMHWTLLEFAVPVVATSDHPVVMWAGSARSQVPQPVPMAIGVLVCLEVRLPLSPTRAVLMTWSDKPDDEGVRVRGSRNHAGRLNAFTIAAADRQWFYLPGTAPPRATGRLLPLSPELVSGYSAAAAERSARRAAVSQEVQGKLGRVLGDRELSVIRLTRGGVQN